MVVGIFHDTKMKVEERVEICTVKVSEAVKMSSIFLNRKAPQSME